MSISTKVKFPISLKLVLIFSLLVVAVLGVTTYMISTLVRTDERIKAEENNHTINGRTAVAVQDTFNNVSSNTKSYFDALRIFSSQKNRTVEEKTKYANSLFQNYCIRNPSAVFIYSSKTELRINPSFQEKYEDIDKNIRTYIKENRKLLEAESKIVVKNTSREFGFPALCILIPYETTDGKIYIFSCLSSERLAENMSTGSYNTSLLINPEGDLLVHSDYEKMKEGGNLSKEKVFESILNSKAENSQILAADENGENNFYAFHKIEFADLVVVTLESEKTVFEAINKTTYRIILFSLAVFFLAIIIIRFFSKGITKPIGTLVEASHEIESGNFIIDMQPKTHDEIGVLTSSFVQMGKGLSERERLKNTFSKFTNKAIAEKAMKGELALGGENRTATIFFSDIRSFTAISEKLKPQEVVEFLNAYMTRMVDCINRNGGVVDKFIGDAIMAVWGAPESTGTPTDDAIKCVNTALMMRDSLMEFNRDRGDEKHPILKIGCGINTGDVVAGQIGSSERMEYTVIGDAVNFASRTESLNKPFATDILITEDTYNLVKDKFIVQEMQPVRVKGKSQPVRIYAVINAVGKTYPATLDDVRKELHIIVNETNKVDVNAEEKKYSFDV